MFFNISNPAANLQPSKWVQNKANCLATLRAQTRNVSLLNVSGQTWRQSLKPLTFCWQKYLRI